MEEESTRIDKEIIPVKIIREKRQLSVRFPANLVDKFKINPEEDNFVWVVEGTDEISLKGALIKRGNLEKDGDKG